MIARFLSGSLASVLRRLGRQPFEAAVQYWQVALQKFGDPEIVDFRFLKIFVRPKGAVEQNSIGLTQLCQKLWFEARDSRSNQDGLSRR